jgi:hypothetical protein
VRNAVRWFSIVMSLLVMVGFAARGMVIHSAIFGGMACLKIWVFAAPD